jgi:hypothetical protein
MIKIALASLLVCLMAAGSGALADERVSFKGKSVTMIVGSAPGGGTDTAGRLLANFLHKYLPGEPNLIVQNMPGAGGISSVNFFVHQTKPDGLTVLMGSESTIDPIIFRSSTNVQYDPKMLELVGGIGRGGSVIFTHKKDRPRLLDKSKPPLIIGNVGPVPREAIQPALWGIEYLGWNARWVAGYHGTNDVLLAFDRGEVDVSSTGNLFEVKDRMKELFIITQTGMYRAGKIVGSDAFGDAPLFPDMIAGKIKTPAAQKAFDYWVALNSADKWLALPPGTPAPLLAAYRKSFQDASKDPEFTAQGSKISEGFTPISAADFGSLIDTLVSTPPEAIDYTKALMKKQGLSAP